MEKMCKFDKRLYIACLIAAFVVIAFSQLDLVVSALFYDQDEGFLGKQNSLCILIHKYGHLVAVGSFAVCCGLWFWGRMHKDFTYAIKDKAMLFICATCLAFPLIVVNGIFKTLWGRARPREIIEFGGSYHFSSPFVIAGETWGNSSFPSGHVSSAVWCLAVALILPKPWRKVAIVAVMALAVVFAYARIACGAHFLSDTLFALILGIAIIFYMWRKFDLDKQ